jgi:hypothetical protein
LDGTNIDIGWDERKGGKRVDFFTNLLHTSVNIRSPLILDQDNVIVVVAPYHWYRGTHKRVDRDQNGEHRVPGEVWKCERIYISVKK